MTKIGKRLVSVLLAVAMVITFIPVMGTQAAYAEDVYTVTIDPGEGGGEAFNVQSTTILSNQEARAGNYDQTKGCFFRDYFDENTIVFKFPSTCTFTAPEGKEFDCWEWNGIKFTPGLESVVCNGDNPTAQITALWKVEEEETHSTADITIPSAVSVQYGDTQTPFDIQVDSLTYINTDDVFNITLFDSVFTNANNEIIPFTVSCNGLDATRNNNAGWTKIVIWPDGQPEYPYTYQGFINIRSEDLSNASPGSYSVSLRYTYRFGDTEEEGTIALSLTVPGGQPPVENCTVTFDAAGGTWTDGTTANKEVTVEKGQAATAPDVPTREGYTFNGWEPADFSNITSNLTVTAQWIENTPPQAETFTVTFKTAGGTWTDGTTADKQMTVDKGQAATAPEVPTRDGFTFDGWEPADFSNITSNLTVTAQWKENTPPPAETFTVTFKAAGGAWTDGTTADSERTVDKGQAATAPDVPTRDGFTFDGWDPADFSNITSNLTVTAQWKENREPQPQPAAQTITASNVTKTYGNVAFSLGAKTSGDGTLTYKSSNTKVVTVDSAGKVTIKGAGTAKITISVSATANYKAATKTITVTVKQAANPLKIGAKTASVKYKKLKKKTQTLAVTKVIKFTKKLNDKKTYTLVSAKKGSKSFKKYFKINKTTGKVTIKKNKKMKKGTYKVKVKIQALGNSNYKASAVKKVTFKVKVK